MSKMSKNTAVFPSNYYFRDLQDVDPRFYAEKDFVMIVPDDIEEALTPPEAIVVKAAEKSETLLLIQDVIIEEENEEK